ncbi:MAG: hypothetical protein AB7F89_11600 [Pirellulaceae bacterium]
MPQICRPEGWGAGLEPPRPVLLIGDAGRDEFGEVAAWLRTRHQVWAVMRLADVSAQAWGGRDPELVIWLQALPGAGPARELEVCGRRWPLARCAVVQGSWCEGDGRTGRPLAGVRRMYWYDAVERLAAWLATAATPVRGWGLPHVATELERLAAQLGGCPRQNGRTGIAVIAARTRDDFEAWRDACASVGWTSEWQRPGIQLAPGGAEAAIWDLCHTLDRDWAAVQRFAVRWRPAHLAVAMSFPRVTDVAQVRALAGHVVAKPIQLPDFQHWLGGLASTGRMPVRAIPSTPSPNCSTIG